MSNEDFNPEDIADLEEAFMRVERETSEEYRMELIISSATMNDMINEWSMAVLGNKKMMKKCWDRYAYIMNQIIDAKLDEELDED